MVCSETNYNKNNNPRVSNKRVSRFILRKQLELVSQTDELLKNSFESQFLDKKSFQSLCFLVICFRNLEVDDELLEDVLILMNPNEDKLLDTIQDFFAIHNKDIPSTLFKVIKYMSKLLS